MKQLNRLNINIGDKTSAETSFQWPEKSDAVASTELHILSNLLESLDAQGGDPGPVSTLLGEMGILTTPKL